VEGSGEAEEEEVVVVAVVAAVAVPQGDLPDAHQAVLVVQARQVAHRAVPALAVPPHPVVDPVVRPEPARLADFPDRMGYPLSPMVLVRVLVPVSWGDSAGVGSLDPPLAHHSVECTHC
jgi:hypothetical protein